MSTRGSSRGRLLMSSTDSLDSTLADLSQDSWDDEDNYNYKTANSNNLSGSSPEQARRRLFVTVGAVTGVAAALGGAYWFASREAQHHHTHHADDWEEDADTRAIREQVESREHDMAMSRAGSDGDAGSVLPDAASQSAITNRDDDNTDGSKPDGSKADGSKPDGSKPDADAQKPKDGELALGQTELKLLNSGDQHRQEAAQLEEDRRQDGLSAPGSTNSMIESVGHRLGKGLRRFMPGDVSDNIAGIGLCVLGLLLGTAIGLMLMCVFPTLFLTVFHSLAARLYLGLLGCLLSLQAGNGCMLRFLGGPDGSEDTHPAHKSNPAEGWCSWLFCTTPQYFCCWCSCLGAGHPGLKSVLRIQGAQLGSCLGDVVLPWLGMGKDGMLQNLLEGWWAIAMAYSEDTQGGKINAVIGATKKYQTLRDDTVPAVLGEHVMSPVLKATEKAGEFKQQHTDGVHAWVHSKQQDAGNGVRSMFAGWTGMTDGVCCMSLVNAGCGNCCGHVGACFSKCLDGIMACAGCFCSPISGLTKVGSWARG